MGTAYCKPILKFNIFSNLFYLAADVTKNSGHRRTERNNTVAKSHKTKSVAGWRLSASHCPCPIDGTPALSVTALACAAELGRREGHNFKYLSIAAKMYGAFVSKGMCEFPLCHSFLVVFMASYHPSMWRAPAVSSTKSEYLAHVIQTNVTKRKA